PQKRHGRPRHDRELLIQRRRLPVVNQDQDAIAFKRLDGPLELLLPVEQAGFLELPAVERLLSFLRLDKAMKNLALFQVVVLHFLIARAGDQFPTWDAFAEDFGGDLVKGAAAGRLVANG